MILITSQSLTVTNPQPNEAHFNKTNQTKPILGSTNHVRVYAAHDREHDCYNNFYTLQRLYTFSMSTDLVTRQWLKNLHFAKYTLPLVYGQEISTRLFNDFD
jgi:hypothetical protein